MNIAQLAQNIGKAGFYKVNGLRIQVKIMDVKTPYGRIDYQIKPEAGEGIIWVNSSSVEVR